MATSGSRGGFFPKLTPEERARAIADPGPTWHDWARWSLARTWILLGFFIVDVFVLDTWAIPLDIPAMVLSLAAAIYLEYLAYEYLYYRPSDGAARSSTFFRTLGPWLRPVGRGIWTPEAMAAKAGRPVPVTAAKADPSAPDPREFL